MELFKAAPFNIFILAVAQMTIYNVKGVTNSEEPREQQQLFSLTNKHIAQSASVSAQCVNKQLLASLMCLQLVPKWLKICYAGLI